MEVYEIELAKLFCLKLPEIDGLRPRVLLIRILRRSLLSDILSRAASLT